MSWSVTDFPYGAPAGPAVPGQINFDLTQSEVNPVFIQAGTEANAQQTEGREIAGFYYRVVNAHWNGTNWVCVNAANPAYGYRLNTSGAFEHIYTAATGGNITWTVIASVQTSGAIVAPTIGPAIGQQHTLPAVASDTIALLAAAQSLSNKTIPSPILSGTVTGTYTLGGTPTITGLVSLAASSFLSVGTNPAGSGAIRLANLAGVESRNAANSADLQIAAYTASNVLQVGDGGAAAIEVEQVLRAGADNSYDIGVSGFRFRNLLISGTVQNGTATMGMQFKKGTGAGDYSITTDGAYHDVDNTNLKLVVTIPTGWKLAVWAQADMDISANQNPFLAIADGGTVLKESEESLGNTSENFQPLSIFTVIAGDGASHTVTMQAKAGGGTLRVRNSTATIAPTMLFLLMPSN